ncbi:hypothetical protein V865_001168 [Kwoniella europaea PYCC6329]|uniref:Uncharacterized protein n=1 Tax=Kwoniella europaea PYCC6329 TaxID=1423913 RepID=A0AAX4K9N5_9TREE
MAPTKRSRSPSPSRAIERNKPKNKFPMIANAEYETTTREFSTSTIPAYTELEMLSLLLPRPGGTPNPEHSSLGSDSGIKRNEGVPSPHRRSTSYARQVQRRKPVRLANPYSSFSPKQINEAMFTTVPKDEGERGSNNAKGKGTEEMKQVEGSKKHGQEGITTPQGTRTPSSSSPNHLILPFDTPLKTTDAQTKTKTSTLPDEDDMTVWQQRFVNLSRATHEDRDIDTSFLTLDHKLKVRDYRAAQVSGNGGSAAAVEAPEGAEVEGKGSTALKTQEQVDGAEHDETESTGAEEVISTTEKDNGDEEVVIEVQIRRDVRSKIVLDLSAMEARRVKVKVKGSG